MWNGIENLLLKMKQYTIEEYYAQFSVMEHWLREQEKLLTPKNRNRNPITNLCENLTLELHTYPVWMRVHILSFCMKCSEELKYAQWLMDEILEADYDVLGEYNKYFLFWQMKSSVFGKVKLQDEKIERGLAKLYRELYESFYAAVHVEMFSYIPIEERNKDLVVIFTSQFLTEMHAPTKTVCDRAYAIQHDLRKKVIIINTAMLIPKKGDTPFYYRDEGGYLEKYLRTTHFKYRDETFEFVQCQDNMPDLGQIQKFLFWMKKEKPYCILNIGGGDLCADLCGNVVPEITISTVFSEMAVTTGTFQAIDRDLRPGDYEVMQILGQKPEHVKKALFTFVFKEQTHHFTRAELGLSDGAFVLLVTGWRLKDEADEEFLKMLNAVIEKDSYIEVVFMGLFTDYAQVISSYPKLMQKAHYFECQEDALAVTECCDLYVNPKRKGGGSSAAEALFLGLPAVTLPVGDAADTAGEDFWVADYPAMEEMILTYCRSRETYQKMSGLARERGKSLTDSKTHFCELFRRIETDADFR